MPGKSREQRSLVGCSPWGHKRVLYTTSLLNNDTATPTYRVKQDVGEGNVAGRAANSEAACNISVVAQHLQVAKIKTRHITKKQLKNLI